MICGQAIVVFQFMQYLVSITAKHILCSYTEQQFLKHSWTFSTILHAIVSIIVIIIISLFIELHLHV